MGSRLYIERALLVQGAISTQAIRAGKADEKCAAAVRSAAAGQSHWQDASDDEKGDDQRDPERVGEGLHKSEYVPLTGGVRDREQSGVLVLDERGRDPASWGEEGALSRINLDADRAPAPNISVFWWRSRLQHLRQRDEARDGHGSIVDTAFVHRP